MIHDGFGCQSFKAVLSGHVPRRLGFSDDQFREISRTAAFIPEADFNALEIPAREVVKYGSVHHNGAKPQSFLDAVGNQQKLKAVFEL